MYIYVCICMYVWQLLCTPIVQAEIKASFSVKSRGRDQDGNPTFFDASVINIQYIHTYILYMITTIFTATAINY